MTDFLELFFPIRVFGGSGGRGEARNGGVKVDVLVVGAGAAGLRCAEVAAEQGKSVLVAEKGRALGRKFLVAGKSGLNLTHAEDFEDFLGRYRLEEEFRPWLREMLGAFDNEAMRAWAAELGVETFVASSGRVYPAEMKGGRLFKKWVEKVEGAGVRIAREWELGRVEPGRAVFVTPEGNRVVQAEKIVLALGGASWSWTGSDGTWTRFFPQEWTKRWQAANCGWEVAWPEGVVEKVDGLALKNVVAFAGDRQARGELRVTQYGLEGGPVYRLGPELRATRKLRLDLKADLSAAEVEKRLKGAKRLGLREICYRLKLPKEARFLIETFSDRFEGVGDAVAAVKGLEVPLVRPRPLQEAISSAGGVRFEKVTRDLELKGMPGVFVVGEMLDWEAPTGGYLLQMCFAMGDWVGRN